jgi:DNA-binding PadR family transcriptional regulator
MHQRNMKWRTAGPPFGPVDVHFRAGPFGGGPVGGAFGGGRGRKRRGDVRAALLLLLAEEPRNGYQLMQAIEELSGGRWRPSPGSIYPTLSQLEDEGLIRAVERDATKLFEMTDAGREHMAERHHEPPWLDDESEAFADLRTQMRQIHVAVMQVAHAGDSAQIEHAAKTLAETRRRLYRILAEDEQVAAEDEQVPAEDEQTHAEDDEA